MNVHVAQQWLWECKAGWHQPNVETVLSLIRAPLKDSGLTPDRGKSSWDVNPAPSVPVCYRTAVGGRPVTFFLEVLLAFLPSDDTSAQAVLA